MREAITIGANYVALLAEAAAAVVILIGTAQALWTHLRRLFTRCCDSRDMMRSRIRLGHCLSLALEFLIAADILKTALSPSWEEIGQLAAIIGIRTVFNLFLQKELEHETDAIRKTEGE